MDCNLIYTKKNGIDNHVKIVQVKRLLVIPNLSYEHFSEVMVNVKYFINFIICCYLYNLVNFKTSIIINRPKYIYNYTSQLLLLL